MTFVIAIAGVSGGGKTVITKRVSELLSDSAVLHFDDFDLKGPKDMLHWIKYEGSSPEAWDITPIVHAVDRIDESCNVLILDYPFGFTHESLRTKIDMTFFIDTPLDIALARRLLRNKQFADVDSIKEDLNTYLSIGRKGYIDMLHNVRPTADYVVDGTGSIDKIASEIILRIEKKRNYKKEV